MNMEIIVVAIIACFGWSNALTVGSFENVTGGIWDEWFNANPDNVKQGRFGIECGNDNLWLVSKRLYRKSAQAPWDSAARGGIVSTLRISTKSWTHQPYEVLDEDDYGDKLFSLNGRLFMLTHSTNKGRVNFHKLLYWEDEKGRWVDTPFDIDPSATTSTTNTIVHLSVTVPEQFGNVAYVVASAHANAQRGSEMVFSKLRVEFGGNVPIKAVLKSITRLEDQEPTAVFFTALKNNTLFAFVENFYSEGYVREYGYAYALDLSSNKIQKVNLAGANPPMDYDDERMFQTRDELFIVGGSTVYGLGQIRPVRDIWSLNLDTLQWRGTNALVSDQYDINPAYDQQGAKLYLAGLKEGVSVAPVHE